MAKNTDPTPMPDPAPAPLKEIPAGLPIAGLPVVPVEKLADPALSGPTDADFRAGKVYHDSRTGEDYAVTIWEDEPARKTHFAKNNAHFWNGTEVEFRERFTKV